jgi:hypothetical protein
MEDHILFPPPHTLYQDMFLFPSLLHTLFQDLFLLPPFFHTLRVFTCDVMSLLLFIRICLFLFIFCILKTKVCIYSLHLGHTLHSDMFTLPHHFHTLYQDMFLHMYIFLVSLILWIRICLHYLHFLRALYRTYVHIPFIFVVLCIRIFFYSLVSFTLFCRKRFYIFSYPLYSLNQDVSSPFIRQDMSLFPSYPSHPTLYICFPDFHLLHTLRQDIFLFTHLILYVQYTRTCFYIFSYLFLVLLQQIMFLFITLYIPHTVHQDMFLPALHLIHSLDQS